MSIEEKILKRKLWEIRTKKKNLREKWIELDIIEGYLTQSFLRQQQFNAKFKQVPTN